MVILNLGSGHRTRENRVDVDRRNLPNIDVAANLDEHPWPFEDNYADRILALDIFEHLENVVAAMDECHRILKPDGELRIRGPHADGSRVWADVTHKRAFTEISFDHFDPGTQRGRRYDYGKGKWKILSQKRDRFNIEFVLTPRES